MLRLITSSRARYSQCQTEHDITAPVTVENLLGPLTIASQVEMFENIVASILINAWESYDRAPPDQGPIVLRTARVEKPDEPDMVCITIADQGHGIPPDLRDHIFEPFISSAYRRRGHGPHHRPSRPAQYGGELNLEDRPEGGVCAILLHPREVPRRKKISPR